MKTITERDGKNVNMSVVGDLHQYPDGTVFEVKDGKLVPGSGGSGGGSEVLVVKVNGTMSNHGGADSAVLQSNLTYGEIRDAVLSGINPVMDLHIILTSTDEQDQIIELATISSRINISGMSSVLFNPLTELPDTELIFSDPVLMDDGSKPGMFGTICFYPDNTISAIKI